MNFGTHYNSDNKIIIHSLLNSDIQMFCENTVIFIHSFIYLTVIIGNLL